MSCVLLQSVNIGVALSSKPSAMEARIDWKSVSAGAVEAIGKLSEYVRASGLEESLIDLVDLRASQINGCAYCVDMHTKDARARGETEQRLYAVAAWRDAPFFTPRERAALAWTEAVTRIADKEISDELYEEARRHFGEKELVDLTVAVLLINGYNRLNISFRRVAGSYQPRVPRKASIEGM